MSARASARLAALSGLTGLLLLVGVAQAHAGVSWRMTPLANTAVAPGGDLTYYVEIKNGGDQTSDGSPIELNVTLPAGLSGKSANPENLLACPDISGLHAFTCEGTPAIEPHAAESPIRFTLSADQGASGLLTTLFEVQGGGGAPLQSAEVLRVTSAPTLYGLDAFDLTATRDGAASTQAAGHPDALTTAIDFPTLTNPAPIVGDLWPVEDVRDVTVSLPPGLVGGPGAEAQCSQSQLIVGEFIPKPECPENSQLGTAQVRVGGGTLGPYPLYNMVPPPEAPARFAFNVQGTVIILDAQVRTDGDYGIDTIAQNVPQALAVVGNTITFWGVPADPAHDPERNCVGGQYIWGSRGESCEGKAPPAAFFRNPTSCNAAGSLSTAIATDSWQHPGDFTTDQIFLHDTPAYPYPRSQWGAAVGTEDCDQVPFEPTFAASPSTDRADSPSGLSVDIGLPDECWQPQETLAQAEDGLCQADLRTAAVTLPPGLVLNPAAAAGREGCGPEQIGLLTPIASAPVHFDQAPATCPDPSKIGSIEIQTPLLTRHDAKGAPLTDTEDDLVPEPLSGSIYLARQSQNPFGSVVAIYFVAEGQGVRIKQAGQISLDSKTGLLTTTFADAPEQPISKIHFELFGGPRATLRTPAACGTYTTNASLTPWSGNGAVQLQSSFGITQGCTGGFDPQLRSGVENPLAGATSPFNLRLSRADATQELAGLSVKLPPGLSGYLAGIPYCPDATLAAISGALGTGVGEEGHPSCPAASQIGRLTVGAGSGPTPFYTSTGRAYLAGPYKGAPLSIAVVAPAVAGPFDLGTVVVRNAIDLDQATAQLSVRSDPLPTIIHGIPLDLRDVRVEVNRDHFTLNPTSCEAKSVDATITSAQGATAARSNHFQVSGCERLGFKPKLKLSLKGKVNRTAHPSLSATYTARPGDANLARAQVKLPPAAFLDNAHIGAICTRVQFTAHSCPPASVYGSASATTPILGYPLAGNVYLRSSDHKLPDLVADLRGPESQPIEVALSGKTDSVKGALRNTFELVPDAPVTRFNLRLYGGKRGLIEMSSGFCKAPRASVSLTAQNNRARDFSPRVGGKCGAKGKKSSAKGGR